MIETYSIYALISVILVSVISIIVAIPFFLKKKLTKSVLLTLLSISVGTLLSAVFLHFIPEMAEHEYSLGTGIIILIGFLSFFLIEKLIHFHHCHTKKSGEGFGHSHAYHLAPINLIGDGIHNFLDGLLLAGAYAASIPLGIAATISVIFHEIPQEIADFGVLLYAGLTRKRAILFNFISASTAIIGTLIGLFLISKIHSFSEIIVPFAAGNLLYIAASNLLPELHQGCNIKDSIVHICAICIGVMIMVAVGLLMPVHVH